MIAVSRTLFLRPEGSLPLRQLALPLMKSKIVGSITLDGYMLYHIYGLSLFVCFLVCDFALPMQTTANQPGRR